MNNLKEFFEVIKEQSVDSYGNLNDLILAQLYYEVKDEIKDHNEIKKVFSPKFFEFNNTFIIDTQIKALSFFEEKDVKEIFLNLQKEKSIFLKRGLITFYCNVILDPKIQKNIKDFFLKQIIDIYNSTNLILVKIESIKSLIGLFIYYQDNSNFEKLFEDISKIKNIHLIVSILSELSKNITSIIKNKKIDLFENLINDYFNSNNKMIKVYLSVFITKIILSNDYIGDKEKKKEQLKLLLNSTNNLTIKFLIKKQLFNLIDSLELEDKELKKFINENTGINNNYLKKDLSLKIKDKKNSKKIILENLSEESIIRILKATALLNIVNKDIDTYDKNKINKKLNKYKKLNYIITKKLFFNKKLKEYIENYSIKYSNPFYLKESDTNLWASFDQEKEEEFICVK